MGVAVLPNIPTKATPSGGENPLVQQNVSVAVPEHLLGVAQCLSREPQDLDKLVMSTQLPTGELLAKLMELELLGAVSAVGGRYVVV